MATMRKRKWTHNGKEAEARAGTLYRGRVARFKLARLCIDRAVPAWSAVQVAHDA